ncbi:hypothetical protein NVV95_04030 [Herbiconiux sp. CPCC 205716]|uniref:O-antigen ligase domain-containing protein n=1 Tax=Herbiconiux gentiana TaxID=2970912 RepID=A0ABT2GBZ2_9MICO|nr:hypothetical protein [Herbiconiux gentiana]MCS5713718.1 hypothetical protein [Herbiconiux gentiana]
MSLRDVVLTACAVLAVPVVTLAAVSAGPDGIVSVLVALVGLSSVLAALANKPVLLIGLLVGASAVQRSLGALTGSPIALWLDDSVLIGIALYIVIRLMTRSQQRAGVLVFILVFVAFLAVAFLRSTDTSIGVYQLRQMGVPAILLMFGMVVDREELRRASPVVITFIAIGALYGVLELTGVRPIDPASASDLNAYSNTNIRENGLPAAYRYFLSDGTVLSRVGGLVLNPPSFGILAASGFIWLRFSSLKRGPLFIILAFLFAGMTFASLGRGGIVVLGLAIVQPFLTKYSGRLAFILVGVVLGAVAYSEFAQQGQSGRHADGFLYGITYALTHPFGGGFGLVGNSVNQAGLDGSESGAGESLAAIFLTALGWFGILLLGWLLLRGIGAGATLPGVALTAAVLVAMVSETAGGLDAAGPLWILGGLALADKRSARDVLKDVVTRKRGVPTPVAADPARAA